MEFLVDIQVRWPVEGDPDLRDRLVRAEAARAAVLAQEGHIVRLWRVPGRWASVGIWRAEDATELHQALESLPFYPWLDITVRPLAVHPSDPVVGDLQ